MRIQSVLKQIIFGVLPLAMPQMVMAQDPSQVTSNIAEHRKAVITLATDLTKLAAAKIRSKKVTSEITDARILQESSTSIKDS